MGALRRMENSENAEEVQDAGYAEIAGQRIQVNERENDRF